MIDRLNSTARSRSTLHASLHRHALRQIPRLIHIRAAADGDVVRQQLQRDHGQHGELVTPWSHAKLPQLKAHEIQEVAQCVLRDIGNMAGFDRFFSAVVKMLGMRRDMRVVRGIVVSVQAQRTSQPAEISRSNWSRRWRCTSRFSHSIRSSQAGWL